MTVHLISRFVDAPKSYKVTSRRATKHDNRNKVLTPVDGGEPWFVKGPVTRKSLNLSPSIKLEIEEESKAA